MFQPFNRFAPFKPFQRSLKYKRYALEMFIGFEVASFEIGA